MNAEYTNVTTLNPISAVHEGTGFTRATVSVVLTAFLALILSPTAAAARQVVQDPTKLIGSPAAVADNDKLNDALKAVKVALGRMDVSLKKGATPTAELKTLATLRAALVEADEDVLDGFDRDLAHIRKHKLPDVIQQRHAVAVAQYKARHQEMLTHLDALLAAQGIAALKGKTKAAAEWLGKQQLEAAPAPFDPNKLGFQVETKKARAPKLTANELKQIAPLKTAFRPDSSFEVATTGSMGAFIAASTVTPPGPEYLAATIDVQITPEIQTLAAQLHNNPVEIYNWVRNNVDWIPTYGSVQGSQLTLDKKAGNAFDTSSLLIALLRAANIAARYAYGTIQVPIDQAMNWAGGFTHPDAVQTFLATGGIPNNAVVSGGTAVALRLEHVWVEAFVDVYPSRGAKNIAPDAWVAMDPSYKQYAYSDGMDLKAGVPFDADGFLTAAQDGATVNEQEGWVQNLNQANIQTRLAQYQQQLQGFIEQQNPKATVGEVLGAKTIRQINAPVLAASLPYKLVATGNRYAALPDGLRHKFQYSLYANAYERSIENPLWTYQEATSNLASKQVTLSFVPASDADRQTIESYLPKPHEDGSPIQPEEFPRSLPAYNIRVTAELRVEGNVVARGGTFTLGTELVGEGGFTYLHNLGDWDLTQERHVSGQNSALAVSLQGITGRQMQEVRARLQVGAGDLTGDLLTATTLGYFAATESFGRVQQRPAGIVEHPGLSYGFFHAQVTPEYRYGLVHRAQFPGLLMDIGHQRRIAFEVTNDVVAWVNYNTMRGFHASMMEGIVPKVLFSTGVPTADAVSAAGLIQQATQSGARLYVLSDPNALPDLSAHSPSVREVVLSSLRAGKTVVIPSTVSSVGSWQGTGYVVVDDQTGTGSFLIEGGSRGGFLDFVAAVLAQPSLLLQECKGSFLDMYRANFNAVDNSIYSVFVPRALSLLAAGYVADFFHTSTLFQMTAALKASRLFPKSATYIRVVIMSFLINAVMTWLALTIAHTVGVVVGSASRAWFCKEE